MLYAVAKINGKQYKVTESEEVTVDRLSTPVGKAVDIKEVILVVQDENKLMGEDAKKASVKAKVVEELLDTKVLVFKHKKRKRYNKLVGHRQPLTKIIIESIDFPGKKKEAKPAPKKQATKKPEDTKTTTKKKESKEKAATPKEKKKETRKKKTSASVANKKASSKKPTNKSKTASAQKEKKKSSSK